MFAMTCKALEAEKEKKKNTKHTTNTQLQVETQFLSGDKLAGFLFQAW